MYPAPAKNDKLLAQKLSLISSCCCKENQSMCQWKHIELKEGGPHDKKWEMQKSICM